MCLNANLCIRIYFVSFNSRVACSSYSVCEQIHYTDNDAASEQWGSQRSSNKHAAVSVSRARRPTLTFPELSVTTMLRLHITGGEKSVGCAAMLPRSRWLRAVQLREFFSSRHYPYTLWRGADRRASSAGQEGARRAHTSRTLACTRLRKWLQGTRSPALASIGARKDSSQCAWSAKSDEEPHPRRERPLLSHFINSFLQQTAQIDWERI